MRIIDSDELKVRLADIPMRASRGVMKQAFDLVMRDVHAVIDGMPEANVRRTKKEKNDG